LLGVSSYRHQPRRPFEVVVIKPEHPVIKGFPLKWQDDPDELYEIKKVWPGCTPLAESLTPKKEEDRHPCIWVNSYGKARVFGTTGGVPRARDARFALGLRQTRRPGQTERRLREELNGPT